MKKLMLICILGLFAFTVKAQQNYEDVVTLKNGSIIHGIIVEQIPDKSIKIKTNDGSVFVYNYAEIQKMSKEQVAISKSSNRNNSLEKTYKNPTTALLFSFLIPGGGQFYNHEYTKGAIMLGVDLVSIGIVYIGATHTSYQSGTYHPKTSYRSAYRDSGYSYSDPSPLMYVGFGLELANGIYSMIDASSSARSINRKNGLAFNMKLNDYTDLALMPDYKLDRFGGQINSVFGAKLSLSLH